MDIVPDSNPQSIKPRYRLSPVVTQHLENSRAWIARAAREARGGSALILGAGPCLDIPLDELLPKFDHVVLNDFDAALLNQALDRLPADARRERIELAVCDLTTPDELLVAIEAILTDENDSEAALAQMTAAIAAIEARPAAISGRYDLVVASCLLSQLHVMTVQNMLARFRRRFGRDVEGLSAAKTWKVALYDLARRMEHTLIDQLLDWLTPQGRCYLSETVQLCYLDLAADGSWETEGSYRMTKSIDLTDYLDQRFHILHQGRWQRLDSPPTASNQGRLFDVHALILRHNFSNNH